MKIFCRAFENASIIDFESYVYRSKIAIMQRQLKMSVLRASLASGKSGLLVSRDQTKKLIAAIDEKLSSEPFLGVI